MAELSSTHPVREPQTGIHVLHDDSGVAVLDEWSANHLQVLVLEDHFVVVLFLAQVEGRGSECGFVPGESGIIDFFLFFFAFFYNFFILFFSFFLPVCTSFDNFFISLFSVLSLFSFSSLYTILHNTKKSDKMKEKNTQKTENKPT